VPRYGVGGTRADGYAVRIVKDSLNKHAKSGPTKKGFNMIPGLFSWANTIPMGRVVGATPNGRRAGDPITHGANPEPGFKEYISLMNQWYSEGLIDQDFFTKTGWGDMPAGKVADVTGGKVGVGRSLYTFPDFMANMGKAAGIELEWNGFYMPTKNKGDSLKVSAESTATNFYKGIIGPVSTQCENVEILLKWYDYMYTEEGALLSNYGIEGQGFTFVDGKPKSTELIYADKEGRAMNSMFPLYAMAQIQPAWYDWERELSPATSQNVWDTKDRFLKGWTGEWTMPAVSPTTEESAEYSALFADIQTYVDEMTTKFITGVEPIANFPKFVEKIKSMNIDRCIELKQNGLNAYYNRPID
jgi:putative aldouronate transport system substrate-binding protein